MSGLVVLEGRWQDNRNISVRSLFDLLMDMEFGSIHEYHFEHFATGESLRAIINCFCGPNSRKRYVYIGSHGDENGFSGSVERVSRTYLNNTLRDYLGGQIRGIFFGSCLFGNERNAEFFFDSDNGIPQNVRWIAGYGRSVDWIESSVLDILFWKRLFETKRRSESMNEADLISDVCEYLNLVAGGLVTSLEFQVFKRRHGRPAEPEALIEWQ